MLKSKCIVLLIFLVCISIEAISQHEIGKYEIRWAVFHPFAAIKIKGRLKKAMVIYREVKMSGVLDTFESGGKLDAFRHCFTMAFLAQQVPVKKLRKLGIAHEKGNKRQFEKHKNEFGERADSLACVMDLKNNELGFVIGCQNKNMAGDELKREMIKQISDGNAWYIKRNSRNEYISCQNEPILPQNYPGKWFLPKCLVKSNE